jgi:hypothetical protein
MQFDFEKVSLKISGKALIFIKMQITKVNFDEFFFCALPPQELQQRIFI